MVKRWNFIKGGDALTTVEFAIIFPFFLIIMFYAIEVVLALFWWQSVEEAAQLGARLAVIWNPAVPVATSCPAGAGELPPMNCKTNSGIYGKSCADSTSPCVGYSTLTCDSGGTGCDSNSNTFNLICDRMRYTFGGIPAGCKGVKIIYQDSGLGFAGGPVIPSVTVSVSGVPFNIVNVPILPNIVSTLPTMSATLTGEDLSSSGGSPS